MVYELRRGVLSSLLPRQDSGGIVGGMPVRRSANQTPDLFAAPPPARASDPLVVRKAALPAGEPKASRPKHVLPNDLARSLRWLDDAEIDLLLSAVTAEAQRRGRWPNRQPQAGAKLAGGQPAAEEISHGLTKGKLNAVRAAFKAGVKPSAIARQFGISRSDVRNALASWTSLRCRNRNARSAY
jgi:hypothetical protein